MPREVTPIPLPEFRLRLAKIYTSAGKAASTIHQLDHVLRMAESVGLSTTADLTTEGVADVILARGPSPNPNTTRGLLGRLRRCCRLAARLRLLDRDDLPDWESLRPRAIPATRNRPHRPEEVARLLDRLAGRGGDDWAGGRLHALACTVACTGLRRMEALHLRVDDVDPARGFLWVVARRRLKTEGSAAAVPLTGQLAAVLAAWLPRCGGAWLFPGMRREGPWVGGSPGYRPIDRLRQAGAEVGIERLGFHSLRHTLATQLQLAGVPTWAIARVLRHSTPFMTEHYLHPSDRDVAELVRDFRYG